MGEFVRVERGDGQLAPPAVATVRLDRPPMNALDSQTQEELRAAAAELTADSSVRAVVIYGGERVFAAGADVKEFSTTSHEQMMRDAGRLSSALSALAAVPKPVIAAVTGYALGGGCELALTADFRISADNARWGQPEILLGIIPGAGGTQRLPRLIGSARAKDLIYSGRFVDSDEALRIGLVDRVVPSADVYREALAMATRFAAGPALALAAAKTAIDSGLEVDLASGLLLESHLFASLFATADRAAGMASFLEHGPGKATFDGAPR